MPIASDYFNERGRAPRRVLKMGSRVGRGFSSLASSSTQAFGWSQSGSSGEIFTVTEGWIVYDGVGVEEVAEVELTLSGSPIVWVYLDFDLSDITSNSLTFAAGSVVADVPRSTSTNFRRVLYQLTYDASLSRYGAPMQRSFGDVHISTPIFGQ